MHEGPQVPNYGTPGRGVVLRPGMTIALEPMVLVGTPRTRVLPDQWTVVSADGSLTAHFEHSVAVTEAIRDLDLAVGGNRCEICRLIKIGLDEMMCKLV